MDDEALFRELVALLAGPLVVVRLFPRARAKLEECAGAPPLETVRSIAHSNPKAAIFAFEDNEVLSKLKERDTDTSLLDSLATNDKLVGETLEKTLDHHYSSYSRWFRDWCATLAKIIRIKRHNRYNTPLERNGVVLVIHQEDDLDFLETMLIEYKDCNIMVLFLSEGESSRFTHIMDIFAFTYAVIDPHQHAEPAGEESEKPEADAAQSASLYRENFMRQLGEAIYKFVDSCFERLEWNVELARSNLKSVKLTSKLAKSAEFEKNMAIATFLMCEEVALSKDSMIHTVAKSNLDHDIQALSQLLYGIYLYRYSPPPRPEHKPALQNADEAERGFIDANTVISHFDKAIALFNKNAQVTLSFLTSVLSVLIGEYEEVNKLLAKNSLLELSSKNDYARAALCMELSSIRCTRAKKKNFQLVMAGHLFNQASLENLSKRCYLSCLEEYHGWDVANEHLYSLLGSFNPHFLVNCLNILSNVFENKYSSDRSAEEAEGGAREDLASPDSDREIYYLRRLMKMDGFQLTSRHLVNTPISLAFQNYPTIYYQHHELPELAGNLPFLVRVPIIYLRRNGIIGTNVKLTTSYVDDLYEKLLDHSFRDKTWQKCIKLDNIKDHVKKDMFSTNQPSRGNNYMTNTRLNLSIQLLNPLNIPLELDSFKVLVQDANFSKLQDQDPTVELVLEVLSEKPKATMGLEWIDCEVKSHNEGGVFHLKEFEKRDLVLTFRTHRIGSFKIVGVCWRLFGTCNFWSPVYTVGKKLRNHEHSDKITLDEFVNQRAMDKTLRFNVHEDRPKVQYTFAKCSDLSLLQESNFFHKKELEYLSYDNMLRFYTEKYGTDTALLRKGSSVEKGAPEEPVPSVYASSSDELSQPEELESNRPRKDSAGCDSGEDRAASFNENLCLFDYFDGESSLIEITLENLERNPISSVTLRFKVLGVFSTAPYPVAYTLKPLETDPAPNLLDLTDVTPSIEAGEDVELPEPQVDTAWNVVNLPDVKVKDETLTEKMYEVVLRFKGAEVTLADERLSIYLYLKPLKSFDGISLIDGSVSITPQRGLDLVVPFKLFLSIKTGPEFSAHFNYKDVVEVHARNNSREDILDLDFTVNDNPVKSTNTQGTVVPQKTASWFVLPIESPLQALVEKHKSPAERLTFTVFWRTKRRFGIFGSSVEHQQYKLLVSVSCPQQEVAHGPEPSIVDVVLTVENVSCEKTGSLSVLPLQDYESESLFSFIGVTRRNIGSLEPGKSVSLDFQAILPLPGLYHFSPLNFKLVSSLDEKFVIFRDDVSTIVVRD